MIWLPLRFKNVVESTFTIVPSNCNVFPAPVPVSIVIDVPLINKLPFEPNSFKFVIEPVLKLLTPDDLNWVSLPKFTFPFDTLFFIILSFTSIPL